MALSGYLSFQYFIRQTPGYSLVSAFHLNPSSPSAAYLAIFNAKNDNLGQNGLNWHGHIYGQLIGLLEEHNKCRSAVKGWSKLLVY